MIGLYSPVIGTQKAMMIIIDFSVIYNVDYTNIFLTNCSDGVSARIRRLTHTTLYIALTNNRFISLLNQERYL